MRLDGFRDSILRSDEALKPVGLKVSKLLLSTEENTFDDVVHALVSLTAIQVGTCLMLSPRALLGYIGPGLSSSWAWGLEEGRASQC